MKILAIESVSDLKGREESYRGTYDGYKITTDTKEILILIDNGQSCCESWGAITSADDFKDFIGAEVKEMRCVDNADYNDCPILKREAGDYVDVFDCAFVDFDTDRGTLQFAVYNSHNGYYGHDIHIVEKTL